MSVKQFLVTVVCIALQCCFAAKLPNDFKHCKRGSANFDECLKNAIEGAIKVLSSRGFPKYGLAQIDPIVIPKMAIGAGSMAVNLEQHYKDVKTYGYKNARMVQALLDFDKKQLNFTVSVPQFVLDMSYEVKGRILLIPVFGNGVANFKLDDCTVHHTLTFDKVRKNDKEYLDIKTYNIQTKTKKANFKFEDLFNGNQELSQSIHKVVNDNWEVIYDDVIGGYNQAYSSLFFHYAKNFFGKVSLDEIFPQ